MKTIRSKYRARRCELDGMKFDSKAERDRYIDLQILQRAGHLTNLERQVRFNLTANGQPIRIRSDGYPNGRVAVYVADFVYVAGGQTIIEDAKGFRTPEFKLKKAIMETMGLKIIEVKTQNRRRISA